MDTFQFAPTVHILHSFSQQLVVSKFPSSTVPAESVSEDTVRSATPGSVRQHRVVHAPPVDDYEPEVKATKEQTHLYDIVKCFGNARLNNKHMKQLKA